MLASLFAVVALLSTAVSAQCSSEERLRKSRQVIFAYNLPELGASAAAFEEVPWGSPDRNGRCVTTIIPNGGCAVPVAFTGQGTYNFAVESRQVFSHLTGEFVDFPENGTCVVHTNVTLGVRDQVPIPFTFAGHVYMDYDENCRIYAARAFAEIPIEVLNREFSLRGLNLPSVPQGVCDLVDAGNDAAGDAIVPIVGGLPVAPIIKREEKFRA